MSLAQAPFGNQRQIAGRLMLKNRLSDVEKVDSAVKFARPGLGSAMGALRHQADDAVGLGENSDDLRSFAVLGFAKADTAVMNHRHKKILGSLSRKEKCI